MKVPHQTRLSMVLLAAAVLAAPSAASSLPGPKERWLELSTPNFTFFCHSGERAARRIAADLEELRAVLARFASLQLSSPVPTYIYVFRNEPDFAPYNLRFEGESAEASGYFARREHANYIAINGDAGRDASAIVYHEYVHYFAANNLPGLPLWFEEGLSELYASFRVSSRKIQLGFVEPRHVVLLRRSPWVPLESLLAADHDAPLYNDPDLKGLFYAQSWAMVHYLLVGSDERRAEAYRFVSLVTEGVPHDEAFRRAFGGDLAALEDELRRYVDRTIFSYLELEASVPVELPIAVRPLPYPDLLYRLGDLLSHQEPPRAEAETYLRAAVDLDPDHAPALAGLGLLAERRAQWDSALDHYRRALQAGPDDFLVQYRGGVYLLERGQDLEPARTALRRATELAPSFGPAWLELTRAHLALGDVGDAALDAAERARRLMPSHVAVYHFLLRLYLAAGRTDDAVHLVASGFGGRPAEAGQARADVVQHEIGRARNLLVQGRFRDAEEVLDRAAVLVQGAHGEGYLRGRIEGGRADIREHQATVRYTEAVMAFNRGDRDTARTILVALEPELHEGRRLDAVRALLDLIDHPERAAGAGTPITFVSGIGRTDIERLNAMIAARDLAGARQFLVELGERANLDERAWVDGRIAEIDAVFAHNRFVEMYNRAVDEFNNGAYGAAIVTLEHLLAAEPDEALAAEARALLEEARAGVAQE